MVYFSNQYIQVFMYTHTHTHTHTHTKIKKKKKDYINRLFTVAC